MPMDEIVTQRAPQPPHTRAAPDRPIFIVGCPRSGTTLLQVMLHSHPRIAVPPENRFLLDIYRRRQSFGDLRSRAARVAVARAITTRDGRFSDLRLDPDATIAAIADGPPTIGSALGIVFREYAAQSEKSRWGDKRPAYLLDLPTVLRLFPDAQIVHIVRDGRECVTSLKRMPWWPGGATTAIGRWIVSMVLAARARRTLRSDQFFELRYEDLVADPRAELTKLCTFLGEEFDEGMLEHHDTAVEAVPQWKTWHARTSTTVSTETVGRWLAQLEPAEIGALERLGGHYLRSHGYRLSSARATVREAYPVARYVTKTLAAAGVRRVRDRRVQQQYGMPVAAQLTSAQQRLAEVNGELAWAQSAAK